VDVAGAACLVQKIETVDMPKSEALASGQTTSGELSTTVGRISATGSNASQLMDFRGKIDLICIDPPFDVGADFTMPMLVS
jgi:adenine-specific DNA-methyltransferase